MRWSHGNVLESCRYHLCIVTEAIPKRTTVMKSGCYFDTTIAPDGTEWRVPMLLRYPQGSTVQQDLRFYGRGIPFASCVGNLSQ